MYMAPSLAESMKFNFVHLLLRQGMSQITKLHVQVLCHYRYLFCSSPWLEHFTEKIAASIMVGRS